MAIVTTDNKHYQNIAEALREKIGEAVPYAPSEMAEGIHGVYEAGKQAEHETFWENALSKDMDACGGRFYGRAWNDNTFKPTKDIKPTHNCQNMFNSCAITDLVRILRECGVQLDISGCHGRVDNMFGYSPYLTTVPFLDVRNSRRDGTNELNQMFECCSQLHTIEGIYLKEDGTTGWGDSSFYGCTALENLTFYGTIGRNKLNVSWSTKLTHDSLMSIINCLADNSGTGTTMTVTLGTENLAKLTDAEKAMATQKGWTLA